MSEMFEKKFTMNKNDYVRLTKIGVKDNAWTPSATNVDEYRSKMSWLSPSVGYEVTGHLINDVQVGSTIYLNRDTRNGLPVPGLFCTTPITQIVSRNDSESFEIITENSKYLLQKI